MVISLVAIGGYSIGAYIFYQWLCHNPTLAKCGGEA